MGLVKKGIALGAGYAVLSKALGAVKDHDEAKMRQQQQQQQASQPQYQYPQGPSVQYGSSRGIDETQQLNHTEHASYCNGSCNGQCVQRGTNTDYYNEPLPKYQNGKS